MANKTHFQVVIGGDFKPNCAPTLPPVTNLGFRTENAIVQVIELAKASTLVKFGILTSSSDNHVGLIIKDITPGSVASLDGRLQPGDHIVRINNQNFTNLCGVSADRTFQILMTSTTNIRLIVARPIQDDARLVPANILGYETDLEKSLVDGDNIIGAVGQIPTPWSGKSSWEEIEFWEKTIQFAQNNRESLEKLFERQENTDKKVYWKFD